jgi:spermidine/putrescine transport system ATP-binding protein
VAFEGNFISVHAVTENGTGLVAELRNDGSATVPAAGSKMHMAFDAKNSSILPDGMMEG